MSKTLDLDSNYLYTVLDKKCLRRVYNMRKKSICIVLLSVLAIFLGFLILLIAALAPSSLGVEQGELDHAYGRVLADIDGITDVNPRYIDTAFLGSHDSFSSLLEKKGRTEEGVSSVMTTFMPVIGNYAYRFGITQTVGIYEQLMQGARFLQIKVTFYENEWYASHTVLSGKIETHITEILRYLSSEETKGEIVGVLFQPIYMGNRSFGDMREYISSIRYDGKNLYDYVNYDDADEFNDGDGLSISDIRYNDITCRGQKAGVILFERRDEHYKDTWDKDLHKYPYYYDLDKNALHVWHQSSNTKKLEKSIEKTYKNINSTDEYNDMLRINQTQACLSVKTAADLCSDITAGSLLKIAKKHNLSLIERADFFDMLRAMPVFQVDYLTSTDENFNARINALIREYNETLVTANK